MKEIANFYYHPQVLLISERANMRVQFEGGNKTRQVQLISQHLCARMHNALLADLARMNMKSTLVCDKSTKYSHTLLSSGCR